MVVVVEMTVVTMEKDMVETKTKKKKTS